MNDAINNLNVNQNVTQSSDNISVPIWFWIVTVIALLWFLMDMSAFTMRVFMSEDFLSSMPENQQDLYRTLSASWVLRQL